MCPSRQSATDMSKQSQEIPIAHAVPISSSAPSHGQVIGVAPAHGPGEQQFQGFAPPRGQQQGYPAAAYPASYPAVSSDRTGQCRSCGVSFTRPARSTPNQGSFYKCQRCCDELVEVGIFNSTCSMM